MALTAQDIRAIVGEVAPAVRGAWIQSIHQPQPHTITLKLRSHHSGTPGKSLTLLLSAEPDLARVHLMMGRLHNPAVPPLFCQFLRAHLAKARIDALEQVDGDRIVRITLATREGPRTLVVELTGRNADLLVLDSQETVMATLRNNQVREGQVYMPPHRTRPITATEQPQGSGLHLPDGPSNDPTQAFPVSAALEKQYAVKAQASTLEQQRANRLADLRKQIKKTRRHIEALQGDLGHAERYKRHARYGDLLKANLASISKGQQEVTVVDYFDPGMPALVIPLDPAKAAHANMEDYFRKHRKYLTAEREVRPRLAQLERDLQTLQDELARVLQDTWQPPTAPAHPGSGEAAHERRSRTGARTSAAGSHRPVRSGPFRRFTTSDGLPIYVGRNAKENEELTFGLAHSDDLWLHARGAPGSHVLIRLERGADAPIESLRDAATLALLYSDLKKSGKGEVIYTKRKYVRKLKGQPPGTVSVTQEKSLFVQLDRTRLQRLKDSQGR